MSIKQEHVFTNHFNNLLFYFLPARLHASAGISCRRVSVRPSHAGIVSKQLNVGSRKQRHTIAQGLKYCEAKDLVDFRMVSPQ